MGRDHLKLTVFHKSDELAVLVYRLTGTFPADERFGLRAQLRRASLSVPTNIVEGCARDSRRDYIRFLDIAFGSSAETEYLLHVAARLGFLTACALVKPSKSIHEVEPASVKKKLKDKAFAAAVSREDIRVGISEMGVDETQHIQKCIDARRAERSRLGV